MMYALAILLLIVSSFLFVWSFNMSYGSHVVEERKAFWIYYLAAHALTFTAISCILIAFLLLA